MSARVSVIISTYNRKDLLKGSIRSVLDQSMQDFELIVVDDCSEQDVEKLVKSFGDPRIRYIRTEKNSGHDGHPKNLGIKAATGEFIAFLDDDDKYRRDALKILSAYAKESKVDVVYGDYLIDGKPGWSVDFSVAQLTKRNFISMSVVLIRRTSLLAVGGFDEDVPKFKDWNLWLRLQKNGAAFMHVPIIVTEVFTQERSISNDIKTESTEDGLHLPTFFNPSDCKIWPDKTALGPRKKLRVAIYTLTMNRLEYTKKMYESINKYAGYPFDWFVIDQGSTDGTQEWIKKQTRDILYNGTSFQEGPWRHMLRYRLYEQNVGLAKGWNNIVDFIKEEAKEQKISEMFGGPGYDIIIKIDNDAELMTDGWLAAMVDIFERNRRVILSPYVEGLEGSPGGVLRQRASGDSPYMLINDRVLGLVPNLGGIVFATPIELFNEWRFDEAYEGNKDMLLSQYARKLGYHLFYTEEFRVWHIDGTAGQHEKFPEYFAGRKDFKPEEDQEEEEAAAPAGETK